MSEFWGKVHFWPSLICMNVIFLPMFLQGMLGMHRRWYDGGQGWTLSGEHIWGLTGFQWNTPISWAAWIMGTRPDSVHHQFLLEHQARQKSERQSVGGDYARMDRALAAAARKFCDDSSRVSRALRIQPARTRKRFHHAKRTGRTLGTIKENGRTGAGALIAWKSHTQYPLGRTRVCGMPRSASGCFWPPK